MTRKSWAPAPCSPCTSTAVHCDGSTTFVGTAEERRKTRFMQNFLQNEGMWMFGLGIAGCLSTANTPAHVDRLCDAVCAGLQAEGFNG